MKKEKENKECSPWYMSKDGTEVVASDERRKPRARPQTHDCAVSLLGVM